MEEETTDFVSFLAKRERNKVSQQSLLSQRHYFTNSVCLVNLNHLSDALWCNSCSVPLSLRHCTQEKPFRNSYVLKIKCWRCQNLNDVFLFADTVDVKPSSHDDFPASETAQNHSTNQTVPKNCVVINSINQQTRRGHPPGKSRGSQKLQKTRESKRLKLDEKDIIDTKLEAGLTSNDDKNESRKSVDGGDETFDPEEAENDAANKIPQQCSYCPMQFNEKKAHAKHMKNEHPEVRSFFCDMCSEEFTTIYFLRKHKMESHLPEDSPKCDTCGKAFLTLDLLNAHKLRHLPKEARQFKCNRCSKKFFEAKRLKVHMLRFHAKSKREFKCAHCPRNYETKPKLLRHIVEHVQDDIFAIKHGHEFSRWKCEYCDKIFKNMGRQLVHMRECHPEFKEFICGWCGEKCTNNKSFQKHRRMNHRTDSLYVCDECGKPALNPKKLELHKLTHRSGNEGREFLCSFCPRAFAENSSLVDHIKRFHVITTYYCANCPKTFKMKFNIRRHMQLHTGEFKHSCQYCGANFVAADGRDHHIRNCHRFMCVICSSIFPTKDEVLVHRIKEHSDVGRAREGDQIFEKITDYNCDVCCRYLSSKQALNTHLRTHTKRKAKSELLLSTD
ncbi:zinc finger protein 62 homolog [Cloeon dipterum]|uniref:zinc finger protein 62 homolog n=1 Tax=Cloeon dipterum TaxID=197152 RepID=UPI00321FFD0B